MFSTIPNRVISRDPVITVTIRDCEVQTFRSGGKGGQNQNKRDTGVRVIHAPSGAVAESREERTQLANKRTAFVKMAGTSEFKLWAKLRATEADQEIQRKVDEMMDPRNLVIVNGVSA